MNDRIKNIDVPGGDILYLVEFDDNIIPISGKNIVYIMCFQVSDIYSNEVFICYYNGICLEHFYYSYHDYERLYTGKEEPLIDWVTNRTEFFLYPEDKSSTYLNSGFSYFKSAHPQWINVTTKEDRTRIIGKISVAYWESFEQAKNQYYERLPALIKLRKKEKGKNER